MPAEPWAVPDLPLMLNTGGIAARLHLSADPVRRLIGTGLLRGFRDASGRLMALESDVDALPRTADFVMPSRFARAFVVRPKPATPAGHQTRTWRRFDGYHRDMPQPDLDDAIHGWWEVHKPELWRGDLFLVTVGGIVAEAGTITGHHLHPLGVRWKVERNTTTDELIGRRLRSEGGGPWVAAYPEDSEA